MYKEEIKRNYPENLPLKQALKDAGRSVKWVAAQLKVSSKVVSDTINGKYKGQNIVPQIKELINQ